MEITENVEQNMLEALFEQFEGFVEARLIAKRGVAFVEYENVK